MSDSVANRKIADGSASKPKADSQLRLVTEEGADIFPDEAEPSDDVPTMISKQASLGAGPPTATATKPAPPETLLDSLRGRKLAHFELIEPIGVGGMAAVLRARDSQLDRFVALKILPPEMARDDEAVRRFHQEARSAAKLDHENIARVFYCGEDQGLHFIAFEFVEGENLRWILERRGPMPVPEAVRIVLQIATGLEHAVSRGVVHRDIKPSNIIITPTGRAKLVDMGLARSMEPQKEQLTQSGMTLGTFDYISPEQALEPREADARSDIYSLGCTFYHMLTGRAPVPEGTAAKKLHHHQHVMPIDPRQLNPEVPDEVAMVVGKMMAKDPRGRYQRPVHLVQHLMQVAQRVGAADDLPEGVLFVDTPLPTEPRKRPLLLVSLAALALAALLMVLSLAPPPNRQDPAARPGSKDDRSAQKGNGGNPGVKPLLVPPAAGQPSTEIRGEQDLLRLLNEATEPHVTGFITRSFDLSASSIVVKNDRVRALTLEGKNDDEDKAPVIGFKHVVPENGEEGHLIQAPFIVEGSAELTILNVGFRIEANKKTPKAPVAAVAVKGSGRARFLKCSFTQTDIKEPPYIADPGRLPIASVYAEQGAGAAETPRVEFEQCFFKGGQSAVGLLGTVDVRATNCAFRPHGAFFHVRGNGKPEVRLQRCSAFVLLGPAFRIDDDAACTLNIEHSVFGRPDTLVSGRDPQNLIYFTTATTPKLTYRGQRNCYENLNALMSWKSDTGTEVIVNKLEEFRREIAAAEGSDLHSTLLTDQTQSVWSHPAAHELKNPRESFTLNPKLRAVRTLDLTKALGVEKCVWGDMPALKPLEDDARIAENLAPNEKVVDPTIESPSPGVYESIAQALAAAKPGDVLLIKHGAKGREVEMEPTLLNKPKVDVTLRPYDGFAPILTLAETRDPNATFFRLHDGRIVFEQLEIVLDPDQQFQSQTFAQLDGNASVTFKNCVVTLRQNARVNPGKSIPLTIVALPEADEAMQMMGARPMRRMAEIFFHNCFLRGEGDVIANRAGRPMDVQADNTLVGLAGSLLSVQGGGKEAMPDSALTLRLTKSSFFLSEPLIAVKPGKHAKGLPPIRVERARECLFVPLEARPLINLEVPELSDATLRSALDWKGSSNAYGAYQSVLDDGQFNFRLTPARWKEVFYQDTELLFTQAAFQLALPARQLWLTTPEAYKPRAEYETELAPYGAALDQQLPAMPKKPE